MGSFMPALSNDTPSLKEVLASKGAEYAVFDPMRAKHIFKKLESDLGKNFGVNCPIIHIIGTNGKGSSGRFIAMGLEQHGKCVLHFSSPHLLNFRERYYYKGADMSDEDLESAHRALWKYEVVREASYFEYASFLALYIARECEYFVCEAGLGGEYDSTSVFDSTLSLFTLIGLDHQDMLGRDIESIARTKLRAMGQYSIIAHQHWVNIKPIAQEIALQKGAMLWFDDESCAVFSQAQALYEQPSYQIDKKTYIQKYALPSFLQDNLANACKVLAYFGMQFNFSSLSRLKLRARCEYLTPHIILDVGHNLDGARALCAHIAPKRVKLVYNSYADKDIEAILHELLPIIKEVLIISVENFRICSRDRIAGVCTKQGITYRDFDINEMVFCASQEAYDEDYLVFGSFSVIESFLCLYQTQLDRQGNLCKIN